MRLDDERRARGRPDRCAEQHVVHEHEVRGQLGAYRGGVGLDDPVELGARHLAEKARLDTLVGVEDEHR